MRIGFTPFNAGVLEVDAAFRLAARAGADFVELSFDVFELEPRLQPAAAVRELSRATGVAVTVHLSFVDSNVASIMPGVRENSVERARRGIAYAADVAALAAVLHTGLVPVRNPRVLDLARHAVRASLASLAPGVPIALENLALTDQDLLRGPAELDALTVAAGEGFVNTLDFGHAFVEGFTLDALEGRGAGGAAAGEARIASYEAGLSRVAHLHVHDNDGSGDQHRPLGDGRIDWARHRAFLSAFPGTACLEVNGGEDDVVRSVRYLRDLAAG